MDESFFRLGFLFFVFGPFLFFMQLIFFVSFLTDSWRAAEHLCQYLIDHPHRFQGRYICELGCGLGLVSILLDKMALPKTKIIATDGDEPTMQLLIENKVDCECDFDTAYLYWGEDEDFVQEYCMFWSYLFLLMTCLFIK